MSKTLAFCLIWSLLSTSKSADVSVDSYSVTGMPSEASYYQIDNFATTGLQAQPFVTSTKGDEQQVKLMYGSIVYMFAMNQSLVDCATIQTADIRSGLFCLFAPNVNSPNFKYYQIRRYNKVADGSVTPAKIKGIVNLTLLDPSVKWAIIPTNLSAIFLINLTNSGSQAAPTTLVKYYIITITAQVITPDNVNSNKDGFQVNGLFTLMPHFKSITSCTGLLIIMNTLNTTKNYVVSATDQPANNIMLFLKTNSGKWTGQIRDISPDDNSNSISLVMDIECLNVNKLFSTSVLTTAVLPQVSNIVINTFTLANSVDGSGNLLIAISQPLPALVKFPVANLESTAPYSFIHFALLEINNPLLPTVPGVPTLLLVSHVPKNTIMGDGRMILAWLDPNTGIQNNISSVLMKPSDAFDDIRVQNAAPLSYEFNIKRLVNGRLEYIDFLSSYNSGQSFSSSYVKAGNVIPYRIAVYGCSSAFIRFLLDDTEHKAQGNSDFTYRLYCNYNGIAMWTIPSSPKTNLYTAVSQMPAVGTSIYSTSLKAANLVNSNLSTTFDGMLKPFLLTPVSNIFTNITNSLTTPNMTATINSYQMLPFYYSQIRGANVTIVNTTSNDQILYLSNKLIRFVYPASIIGFDFGIDEVFPTLAGAIVSEDNKRLGYIACTESADLNAQLINMNCSSGPTFSQTFLKILSVRDYFQKCGQVLIMAKNSSSLNTNNQLIFITFNYTSYSFSIISTLTNRQYFDMSCTQSGSLVSLFAVGWNINTSDNITEITWIDGNLSILSKNTVSVREAVYIGSAQYSVIDKNVSLNYFQYNSINNIVEIVRLYFEITNSTSFSFKAQPRDYRYLPISTGTIKMCFYNNYYLIYPSNLLIDSVLFVYTYENTGTLKTYHQVLRYDLKQYNLTSIVDIYCHQLAAADTFSIYALQQQSSSPTMNSILLTFIIDPMTDARMYNIINTTKIFATVQAGDDMDSNIYFILRQYIGVTERWRVIVGKEQVMVQFKNISIPSSTTSSFNMTLNFNASNNQIIIPFSLIVNFESTNPIAFTPQVNLTFNNSTTWDLIPKLPLNLSAPILNLLQNLSGPILKMQFTGDCAFFARQMVENITNPTAVQPKKRTTGVAPTVVSDFAFNTHVIYIEFDSLFYVYVNQAFIIGCSLFDSGNNVNTVATTFKIALNNNCTKVWIIYAANDNTLYGISVSLPPNNTVAAVCSNPLILSSTNTSTQLKHPGVNVAQMIITTITGSAPKCDFLLTFIQTGQNLSSYNCTTEKPAVVGGPVFNIDCGDYEFQPYSSTASLIYSPENRTINSCFKFFDADISLFTKFSTNGSTLLGSKLVQYLVCLGVNSTITPDSTATSEIMIGRFYIAGNGSMLAYFSSVKVSDSLIDGVTQPLNCIVITSGVITCGIPNKLSTKIKIFSLTRNATCESPDKYCFTDNPIIIEYRFQLGLSLTNLSLAQDYFISANYLKQGNFIQDDAVILLYKYGTLDPIFSVPCGKFNALTKRTFLASFYGMNPSIFFTFEGQNMTLTQNQIGSVQIKFNRPNMTLLDCNLSFLNLDPPTSNQSLVLKSLFTPDKNQTKNDTNSKPPPTNVYKEYWYLFAIGGVVVLAVGGGVAYYLIKRAKLMAEAAYNKDTVINKLEDFMF